MGKSGGDIKECLLRVYLDLLVIITGPFLFSPGGFDFIVWSSLVLQSMSPAPTLGPMLSLGRRVLGKAVCVGGRKVGEEVEYGGKVELQMMLLLHQR